MNSDIFFALAQSLCRPDLAGPLVLGLVATDLFALAIGLKRASSLFKKLEQNPNDFPALHILPGTRRKYFKLSEVEAWHASALKPASLHVPVKCNPSSVPQKRLGRPTKVEQREAARRGISVAELRSHVVSAT